MAEAHSITDDQLREKASALAKNDYGEYLGALLTEGMR